MALIAKYRSQLIVNIANEAGPEVGQGYDDFERVYDDAIHGYAVRASRCRS